MKIMSLALATSLYLVCPAAHGMYQQPPPSYEQAVQPEAVLQPTVQFGPFQSYQGPTPSAPPDPSLQQQIIRRSRLKSLLLKEDHQAEHMTLIESIGSSQTAANMYIVLALLFGCNYVKDICLSFTLSDLDKTTILTNLIIDSLFALAPIGVSISLSSKTRKAESTLINLLHQLDRLSEGVDRVTSTEQVTHPSYRRSILYGENGMEQTGSEQQAPLTALQLQHAQDIDILKELGSLDAQTKMWSLTSLLFGANALKDCVYYNGQGKIPVITTTVQGIGSIVSLMLVMNAREKYEHLEKAVAAHVQKVTNEHDEV